MLIILLNCVYCKILLCQGSVVFVESMVLNKPVITTDVSGVDELKEEHYALITQKDENSIYNTMKNFIEQGFKIQEKFDPEKYNKIILENLEKLF